MGGSVVQAKSDPLPANVLKDMADLDDLSEYRGMSTASVRTRDPLVVDPPNDLSEMLELGRFLEHHTAPALLLGPDGEQIPLPMVAYDVLRQVVSAMERGEAVSVEPIDRQLTTQQAATLLGISRSTLVRLLDEHELPFERFGESRHRRLRLHDVLAYRDRKRADRRSRLDELTRQADEDGLYDVDADAYKEALAQARKQS
ncbi:excisionase family DNA-binding protein [Agromyces mediolanus]|uniref:helix-turn-helix domain-containing protein n=1 Tax=Agromyces mediolanus TaxID=41986 RepID=UPI00203D7593|nr:excisionase family DNA-binding protein [Agromyces mediolanus]MCM3658095.1 excisionase family DNA-binding protein [Agromyces mediolanus]